MNRTLILSFVLAIGVVAVGDILPPGDYSTKFEESKITDSPAVVVNEALNPAQTQVVTENLRNPVTHKIWNAKDGLKQAHCSQTKSRASGVVLSTSCTLRESKDGKRLRPVKIPRRVG